MSCGCVGGVGGVVGGGGCRQGCWFGGEGWKEWGDDTLEIEWEGSWEG